MDFAQILRELNRRRGWVALAGIIAICLGVLTAYTPSGFPPTLKKKTLEVGTAQTKIILDSPESSLVNTEQDLEAINMRAMVYAQVLTTQTLEQPIAKRSHLTMAELGTSDVGGGQPGAEERSTQIVDESKQYMYFAKASGSSPVITIFAQGPSGEGAARLANAAAVEAAAYMKRLADPRKPLQNLQVRQLGRASGGVVNSGANKMATVLATGGSFIALCLLILLASSVSDSSRRLRTAGAASAAGAWPQSSVPTTDATARTNDGGDGTIEQEPDVASVRSIRRR